MKIALGPSHYPARLLVLLLPAIILIICLLNSKPLKLASTNPQDHQARATPQSSDSPHSESNRAAASRLSLSRNSIQRSQNETLLYAPTIQLVRDTLPNSLFTGEIFSRKDKADGPLTFSKQTRSAIETNFTPQTVKDFLASTASALSLPLNKDEDVVALIDNVLTRDSTSASLFGSLLHEPGSQVHLVFHDGTVFGNISRYGQQEFYEITAAGDGDIAIREIDPSKIGVCQGDDLLGDAVDAQLRNTTPEAQLSVNQENPGSALSVTDLTVIDLVVGYGSQAASSAGGISDIEARILAAVDQVNLAFSNSSIPLQTFLAGTIQDPDYVFPGRNPDGPTLARDDELGDLDDPNDGSLDAVTDFQALLGADHSTFIVRSSENGFSGFAGINGDSAIVALTSLTASAATFSHELGHSLGCRHAWGDDGQSSTLTRINYGWRFITESGEKRRTIMALNPGTFSTRLPYFSNPNIQFNGANTGAVPGFDATDDPTVDQSLVLGGRNGTHGAGYDGNSSGLGANNAEQINSTMAFLASNNVRTNPLPQGTIEVFHVESQATLSDNDAFLAFNSESTPRTINFRINNISAANSLDRLALNITGPDSDSFSVTAPAQTDLGIGESTSFALTINPSSQISRNATLEIISSAINAPTYTVDLSVAPRALFLSDSLEDAELTAPFTDSLGAEFPFTMLRDNEPTPSPLTGPSGPFEGDFYRFTEASAGNNMGRLGAVAIQTTLDLSEHTGTVFQFRYHMYGTNIGSLHLDVIANGTTHESLWQRNAQQHESSEAAWSLAQVDLSPFDGDSEVIVRLRGELNGEGFEADTALDAIEVFSTIPLSAYEAYLVSLDFPVGSDQTEGLRPADDFNHDGIANLHHFVSGGNMITGESSDLLSFESSEGNDSVSFPILNNLSGYSAGIETSVDLKNWTHIPLEGLAQTNESNMTLFTYEIPSDKTSFYVRYYAKEE